MFCNENFVDPTDPYKLALVDAGLRPGHFCIEMDKEEQEEIGEYEMQGKNALQRRLEDIDLPFETITRRLDMNPEYGNGEQTVYYFAVTGDREHLEEFVSKFRDDPQDGETIGRVAKSSRLCLW